MNCLTCNLEMLLNHDEDFDCWMMDDRDRVDDNVGHLIIIKHKQAPSYTYKM